MKVALYGGSFDPVHRGHLESARAAASWLGLDRVILLPARRPPHKPDRVLASSFDRYALLAAAIVGEPWAELSPWELEREGVTYTHEQLAAFRSARPADSVSLLIGADSLADFPGWRRSDEILDSTGIAVLPREPFDRDACEARLPANFRERVRWLGPGERTNGGPVPVGEIWVLPLRPVTISSTMVRARLATGDPVGDLVPAPVAELIRRHRLYSGTAAA